MRKNQREGYRNRDSHFIEQFSYNKNVEKVLIINRPITIAEMIYKRTTWRTIGQVIYQTSRVRLVKTHPNTYVLDYLSLDFIGNLLRKKAWYWKSYGSGEFIESIKKTLSLLKIEQYICLFQCPYSSSVLNKLSPQYTIFDADDNWLRFPTYLYMHQRIKDAYQAFASAADWWITNSSENKVYFSEQFSLDKCDVIKNGVDIDRFQKSYPLPLDLTPIEKPIIGFGGSISHLIDVELINFILKNHPNKNFVFIGQILNKKIFREINNYPNFIYLGDKHYDTYPAYISHFDICIIPYVTGLKTHGGDALKFYEYLAAKKKIVSTNGNGVFQANSNVYLANNHNEFSILIDQALQDFWEPYIVPEEFTWKYKTDYLVKSINYSISNSLN